MTQSEVTPRRTQRAARVTKGDRNEQALLEAAGRLLASGQFATASVAELADEANISREAFYFYFSSKQALLASLIDDAVSQFNAGILAVAANAQHLAPAVAVRSTVESAVTLWWTHADVLKASFELGASTPEVYDRTMANFAIVRAPTVELLQRYGTVAEADDLDEATELVMTLMLMCERTLYDLMRGNPSRADRDRVAARLTAIWLRAFGIEQTP